MIEHSDSIKNIATALVKAQAVMEGATKDGRNPAFKSTYATLASVIEAARGPLTENGIAFLQAPGDLTDAGLKVTTTLVHTSGEWMSSTLTIALSKRDPQGIGSAITYALRYSLQAMLGLPPVDDDAEAATDRERPAWRQEPERKIQSVSRTVESILALVSTIGATANEDVLDELLNDEGNVALFAQADAVQQDEVRDAIARRREYFASQKTRARK